MPSLPSLPIRRVVALVATAVVIALGVAEGVVR
jgi:hypothetical protein